MPSAAHVATVIEAGSQHIITAMWGGVAGGVLRTSGVYYNNEGLRILGLFRERGQLPDDVELEGFALDRMTKEVYLYLLMHY